MKETGSVVADHGQFYVCDAREAADQASPDRKRKAGATRIPSGVS
jgi:hypothetical protein